MCEESYERYDYGDEVRVVRNVRNDGTYPGLDVGAPLVRRCSASRLPNLSLTKYSVYMPRRKGNTKSNN